MANPWKQTLFEKYGLEKWSQPSKTTHTFKKKFSIFSRKQVNQVNHQKHTYYISGKSLELGQLLETKHCMKKLASRNEVNPKKRRTHLKFFALDFLERQERQERRTLVPKYYISGKLSRVRATAWNQTLFEKIGLEKWSQHPKTTSTLKKICSRLSRETKSPEIGQLRNQTLVEICPREVKSTP